MFEALTSRLTGIFGRLSSRGRLTEQDVDEALREVRLALLEADVHFQVARGLVARVREKLVGAELLHSLNPAQQVIKAVHEELTAVLGGSAKKLDPSPQPPSVLLLAGLQGSGKTTTAAKLALLLRRQGQRPLLVAADLRRPAAVDQLVILGRQLDVPVYQGAAPTGAVQVAQEAVQHAVRLDANWVVVDTAGRLHIDQELMDELAELQAALHPAETLLVLDAMTGQDAVQAAQEFHRRVALTGLVLTKLDGDARGGAALSVVQVTGVPVKLIGIGEKSDALEVFHPDRMATRILGMGDLLTLIEKAQENYDQKQARELERKMRKATFNLEDFRQQLQQVKKMGSMSQLMEMVPGFSQVAKRLGPQAVDDGQLRKIEAIICSMTPQERAKPDVLNGSRRRRVAQGSGTTPQDVNQLLNQFRQTQKLMQQMTTAKGRQALLRTLRG